MRILNLNIVNMYPNPMQSSYEGQGTNSTPERNKKKHPFWRHRFAIIATLCALLGGSGISNINMFITNSVLSGQLADTNASLAEANASFLNVSSQYSNYQGQTGNLLASLPECYIPHPERDTITPFPGSLNDTTDSSMGYDPSLNQYVTVYWQLVSVSRPNGGVCQAVLFNYVTNQYGNPDTNFSIAEDSSGPFNDPVTSYAHTTVIVLFNVQDQKWEPQTLLLATGTN